MKNIILIAVAVSLFSSHAFAGTYIEWENVSTPPVHGGTITNCGAPKTVDFLVSYAYNYAVTSTGVPTPSCPGGVGSNPYRITIELFRGNTSLGSQSAQYSSCWARHLFTGIPAQAGTYSANIKFERRVFISTWQTTEQTSTPGILAVNSPAVPDFKVNGLTIPGNGAALTVDSAHPIILDGSITQCATKYLIGAEESDISWNRTLKYEWARWFTGAPTNAIYLQQLATTYSWPPDWLGQDNARRGAPLASGFLDSPANQQPRYYRVALCTSEPTWACKHVLIRVID